MQFGQKNTYKTYLYSRPVIVALFIIAVLLLISVSERFGVERDMSSRRAVTEADLVKLEQRKEQLETRVEYLEGERGIEEEIRKNFDVAREGEQVIILVGDDSYREVETEAAVELAPWYIFWR